MNEIPQGGCKDFLIKTTDNGFIMDYKKRHSGILAQKVYLKFSDLVVDLAYETGIIEINDKDKMVVQIREESKK